MENPNVIIVGAGIAGLSCALALQKAGVPAEILEASDGVGGRVRTDLVDGHRLDRGFQVYLKSYPLDGKFLDYGKLGLREFEPGAAVFYGGRLHRFRDPSRRPWRLPGALFSTVGTFPDKLRTLRLRSSACWGSVEDLFKRPETTVAEALRRRHFSSKYVRRFWTPFLRGVFLDPELAVSSRMLEFIVRMFTYGAASLPGEGMEAIPRQMAAQLPPTAVHLRSRVTGFQRNRVVVEGGGAFLARHVVLATDGVVAHELVRKQIEPPTYSTTFCLYFSAPGRLGTGRLLMLNGEGRGPINNAAVLTEVAPGYAPPNSSLLSATVLDPGDLSGSGLEDAVRAQLGAWLQADTRRWRCVGMYRIRRALPVYPPGRMDWVQRDARLEIPGFYVCGDYCATPSLLGAVESGKRAAQAVVDDIKAQRGELDWSD